MHTFTHSFLSETLSLTFVEMSGFKATKFAPKRAASKLDEDARKQVRLEKEADIPRINGQVPGEEVRFPLQGTGFPLGRVSCRLGS